MRIIIVQSTFLFGTWNTLPKIRTTNPRGFQNTQIYINNKRLLKCNTTEKLSIHEYMSFKNAYLGIQIIHYSECV